jgi:hypothetical protein
MVARSSRLSFGSVFSSKAHEFFVPERYSLHRKQFDCEVVCLFRRSVLTWAFLMTNTRQILHCLIRASLIVTAAAFLAAPVHAQSSSAKKKRTVWVAPPTGSLLGGGYADAGNTDSSNAAATTLGANEKSSFRTALGELNTQAGTIVDGYALIIPAVALQTGVPQDTIKKQRAATGMTYGELLVANSMAKGSGKAFNEIVNMRGKEKSWQELSLRLRINIDSITARLKNAAESVKYAQSRKDKSRQQNIGDLMNHTIENLNATGKGG